MITRSVPPGAMEDVTVRYLSITAIMASTLLLSCCRRPVSLLPEPEGDALVCGVVIDAGWDAYSDMFGPAGTVERCEGSEDSEDEDLDPIIVFYPCDDE